MKISASIMCADLTNLERECLKLELAGVDRIHIDIMDGNFVPNIVLGFDFIRELRKVTGLPLEVHLMTYEPEKYLKYILPNDVQYICIHAEVSKNIEYIIDMIKDSGRKAGVAINPSTPLKDILPYLEKIDMITFMTVEPGFAGQPFEQEVIEKIKEIKNIIKKNKYDIELETDGHMDEETVPEVVCHGVDVIVAGSSSLFKKGMDYREATKNIRSWVRASEKEADRCI